MVKINKSLGLDVLSLLFLTIICGLFFYKTFLHGLLPLPSDALVGRYHPWKDALTNQYPRGYPYKNPLITDAFRQQIVWRNQAIQAWKNESNPGWDPYSFGGSPLDINVQSGAYYPLNIFFWLFPFEQGWTALIISQMLCLVWFSYLLMRDFQLSKLASIFGSISLGFSGFSISWLTWGTIVAAFSWFPLLLLCFRHLLKTKKVIGDIFWLATAILASIATITAGHLQVAAYVIGTSVIYWFIHSKKNLKLFLLIFTYCVSLAIIFGRFFLRFLTFLSTTVRSEALMWKQEGFFVPFKHLVQLVAPDYFGNPSTMNYFGAWNYGELVSYIGIAGVVLAILGAMHSWRHDRMWVVLVGVSLLFSLDSPIARLPYWLKIPFISSIQPTRLLCMVDFGLAILAAFGLDLIVKSFYPAKQLVIKTIYSLLGICCVLTLWNGLRLMIFHNKQAIVSLRNMIIPIGLLCLSYLIYILPLKRRLLAVMLIGILVVDIFRFGWKFTPFTPKEFVFPPTKIISYLKQQAGPFRVLALDTETAPPNSLGWYQIETFSGYNPLYSERYSRFAHVFQNGWVQPGNQTFQRLFDISNFMSPLARLANVRYAITIDPVATISGTVILKEGETYLTERETLPRWYFANRVESFSSEKNVLNAIASDSLTDKPAFIENELNFKPYTEGNIKILSYQSNSQVIETQNPGIGFLVNSTAWDRRWHAYIDEVEFPILRTNYLFMGLKVPQGIHKVTFTYK